MTSAYIRPIYLAAGIFNEMHPTVTHENSSSSGKGVTRHANFILKTKIIFSKNPGVDRVLSDQRPYTIYRS